ncbi:unnamed protein product [Meloidogyne enterolobii]|uniref:Uncharacterized protein n=1 Tax=Meloidogyne enterolobii TaxID=390850 RepID=A0ACB0ZHV9_MELEN
MFVLLKNFIKNVIFRFAFTYSITNEEFYRVKGGYAERHNIFCVDASECNDIGGKCLDVADYSIGWARRGDFVRSAVQQS